jgi:membrane protein
MAKVYREHIGSIGRFLKVTYVEWQKDHPELLAAGLGYFMLFSLPPLLIIAVATLSYLFANIDQKMVIQKLSTLTGWETAQAITTWLDMINKSGAGKATVVSILVLWLGASRVFIQLRTALNVIWKAQTRQTSFWRGLLIDELLRVLVVVGVAVFLVLVFVMDTLLAFLNKTLGSYFSVLKDIYLWQGVSFIGSVILLTIGIAAIYRYVPDARIHWQDVWPGAAITAILLSVGKTLISLYIGFQSFSSAYGAAGSMIVVMIWIYFAAQIFFFGAKLTWLYASQYGSLRTK